MFNFGTAEDSEAMVRDVVDSALGVAHEDFGAWDITIDELKHHLLRYRVYWKTAYGMGKTDVTDKFKNIYDYLFTVLAARDDHFRSFVLHGKHRFLGGPKQRDYYQDIVRSLIDEDGKLDKP